jgi:hypothetical protein
LFLTTVPPMTAIIYFGEMVVALMLAFFFAGDLDLQHG